MQVQSNRHATLTARVACCFISSSCQPCHSVRLSPPFLMYTQAKRCGVSWRERIVTDPGILVGKPVVKGTRLAIEFIVDLPAQGWSQAEILQNYPSLTREDILACQSCASAILAHSSQREPAR
jgi:uncharacterized protein (DUF433 family)